VIGKSCFQDREQQDVATEAYRDVFTAVLKTTLADRGSASHRVSAS
jgi:hypothetical protein